MAEKRPEQIMEIMRNIAETPNIPEQARNLAADTYDTILELQRKRRGLLEILNKTSEIDVKNMTLAVHSSTAEDDIYTKVVQVLRGRHQDLLRKPKTDDVKAELLKAIVDILSSKENLADKTNKTVEELSKKIVDELTNFKVIQPLLDNPDVEEIQIDDFDRVYYIKSGIPYENKETFSSPSELNNLAEKLIRTADQVTAFGPEDPVVRLRIGDTTRVTIVRSPVATRDPNHPEKGPVFSMAIRKQQSEPFPREVLVNKFHSICPAGDIMLASFIKAKQSTAFYGETNTGKTAMMTTYIQGIKNRRIVSIAEVDEMNLGRIDRRKTITENGREIKNPNYMKPKQRALMWEVVNQDKQIYNGMRGFTGLVNLSLTFTPEVLVLQETKGKEIKDVMEAAITGSQALVSLHANSPRAFRDRVILMYSQSGVNVREESIVSQIQSAFRIIVHAVRLEDGTRKIGEITEIVGAEGGELLFNTLYKFIPQGIVIENGRKVVKGEHYLINEPSQKTIDEMRSRLTEEEMTEFQVALSSAKRRPPLPRVKWKDEV